jgi:hypothetical protein
MHTAWRVCQPSDRLPLPHHLFGAIYCFSLSGEDFVMSEHLSRNNIKLHFSDLPSLFSEKLKKFFSGQYQLNEDVATQLQNIDKKFQAVTQKLTAMDCEMSQLKQEVTRLKKYSGG